MVGIDIKNNGGSLLIGSSNLSFNGWQRNTGVADDGAAE